MIRTMNYRLTVSGRGPALAIVVLLTLGLLFCLVNSCLLPHSHHGEAGDVDMLRGVCGPALTVAFLASNLMFVSMSWWLLTSPGVSPFSVSLHLPDPPPKSPALL